MHRKTGLHTRVVLLGTILFGEAALKAAEVRRHIWLVNNRWWHF